MEKKGFFFSSATLAMARLVPELVPPISTSRPCVSNHSRALAAATSALFWWSATSTSTFLPATAPPRSATAILIISAPAGPSMSAYRPDRSVMKPMRITSPETWAWAGAPAAAATREQAVARVLSFIGVSLGEWTSDAQVFMKLGQAVGKLGLGEFLQDAAVLHHEEAVGQRRG